MAKFGTTVTEENLSAFALVEWDFVSLGKTRKNRVVISILWPELATNKGV
jgi:hypothetical protein